jgi:FKBP-type peptidyl-prolyl cis-trans isomerase
MKLEIGAGHVISGLDEAVQQLSLGQTAEIVIPPLFAYGSAGCFPHVLPNATCILRVQVVAINGKR